MSLFSSDLTSLSRCHVPVTLSLSPSCPVVPCPDTRPCCLVPSRECQLGFTSAQSVPPALVQLAVVPYLDAAFPTCSPFAAQIDCETVGREFRYSLEGPWVSRIVVLLRPYSSGEWVQVSPPHERAVKKSLPDRDGLLACGEVGKCKGEATTETNDYSKVFLEPVKAAAPPVRAEPREDHPESPPPRPPPRPPRSPPRPPRPPRSPPRPPPRPPRPRSPPRPPPRPPRSDPPRSARGWE